MYKQPLSPPIFTEGRRGASVHRLFYEGDKKLLMNTIMNTEIMNTFPKTFVQDCISITIIFLPPMFASLYFYSFPSSTTTTTFPLFSLHHQHHHKKHNLPWQFSSMSSMSFIDHQHEKTKKENQKCCFPRA